MLPLLVVPLAMFLCLLLGSCAHGKDPGSSPALPSLRPPRSFSHPSSVTPTLKFCVPRRTPSGWPLPERGSHFLPPPLISLILASLGLRLARCGSGRG